MALLRSLSLEEKGVDKPEQDGDPLQPADLVGSSRTAADKEEEESTAGAYLPDECVRLIKAFLTQGESAGAWPPVHFG
jgi:hypothetical protein